MYSLLFSSDVIHKYVRDLYYKRFPELESLVPVAIEYMKTVKVSQAHGRNSLSPGKFEWNFRHVIFKQILVIDGWGISCEIALIWMSLDFTDDLSMLTQISVTIWRH